MKITDLKLTITERKTVPWRGTGMGNVDTTGRAELGILTVSTAEFFELILPPERHQWGLAGDLTPDAQGYLHAPAKPGLGVELDWPLIKRHTTAVVS
jgi:L-alanine-DL-glutamate epimerase-like enolase superfamily enzyme